MNAGIGGVPTLAEIQNHPTDERVAHHLAEGAKSRKLCARNTGANLDLNAHDRTIITFQQEIDFDPVLRTFFVLMPVAFPDWPRCSSGLDAPFLPNSPVPYQPSCLREILPLTLLLAVALEDRIPPHEEGPLSHVKGQGLGRRARRVLRWSAAVAVVGAVGVVGVRTLRGGGPAPAPRPVATASRGDIVVSVGALGRIVEARSGLQAVPSPGATGTAAPSPGAVFASARGSVSKLLVAQNARVTVGQVIALIDDGGAAAAAVALARARLATASLEARQALDLAQFGVSRAEADLEKLRGGTTADRTQAVSVARRNVDLAKQRLAGVVARPAAAELSAAGSDLSKAEAELAALLQPAQGPAPEALVAAQQAVSGAEQKLARVNGVADPAAVKTAEAAVKKAELDLAVIVGRPDPVPTPPEIDAAKLTLDAARATLAKLVGPPDITEVNIAKLDLEKARAELALLIRRPPAPSPEAIAAARQAVRAAALKRAKLLGPPKIADRTSARLDLERAQLELRKLTVGPSPTVRAAADQAMAAARVKLQLAGTQPNIKVAEARLAAAQTAERHLTIVAPARGSVTALLTQPGSRVDPSTPVATITDVDHLAAVVDLSEFDVARVKSGMRAVVSVDALGGKSFRGKVGIVALNATNTGGVVSFPVQVALVRSTGLRTGLNVSVRIIVAQRRAVVQVPLDAVLRDPDDRPIVTVVDTAGAETTRRVTLGLANNKRVEIVKGLQPGARILLGEPQGVPGG